MKFDIIGELRAGPPLTQVNTDTQKVSLGLLNTKYDVMQGLRNLTALGLTPNEIGVDFMVLAALVHAADTRISRKVHAQDGWTRQIRLVVPVSDPGRWNDTREVLQDMLKFLTGDFWEVEFTSRPAEHATLIPVPRRPIQAAGFTHLALFSGGLDSLIDAVNVLHSGGTPLVVSHAGEGVTSQAQLLLLEKLRNHHGQPVSQLRVWLSFPKNLIAGPEFTTRARSFLFFSMGVVAGMCLPEPFTLRVPENGLIALNVPLDPLRLGALSTRTTHPYYMARWNEMLRLLGINGALLNSYWDQTKGEMVATCRNPALLQELLEFSVSCSAPSKGRFQGDGPSHCGHCLPCLIRQASVLQGFGSQFTDPTLYRTSLLGRSLLTTRAEGKQVRSFQFAWHRLNQKPERARLWIHKPGPLTDVRAHLPALQDVYWRGMQEVATLLQHVVTTPK